MAKRNKYNESSFRVLSDANAMRQLKYLFIGDAPDTTHLLVEIIDNAIDEIVEYKAANTIVVNIDTKNNKYTVADNGRGIPLGYYKDPETKKKGKRIPIEICTKLFSGGKFDNEAYKKSGGLHGVGVTAVNYLSKQFAIKTNNGKTQGVFKFVNGVLETEKITRIGKKDLPKYKTIISYIPDETHFDAPGVNLERIKDKLTLCNTFLSRAQIHLIVDDQLIDLHNDRETYFNNMLPDRITDLVHITASDDKNDMELYFSLSSENSISKGSVNLLPVHRGKHIQLFKECIVNAFLNNQRKGDVFTKKEIQQCLLLFGILITPDQKFSDQIKTELCTSIKLLRPSFNLIEEKLNKWIKKNPDTFNLLSGHLNKLKIAKSKRKLDSTVSKNLNRGRLSALGELIDCRSKNVNKTELFIVEGKSAGGTVKQARDPNIQAILPLRGKFDKVTKWKNVEKHINTILKKSKLRSMIESIGIDLLYGKHKLRYGKYIILTDRDADGEHIACLLMLFFVKLCPEIVRDGMLYYCKPPLYGYYDKKKFVPVWTTEEYIEISKKRHVTRFKGLGEMNPDQMYYSAIDPKTRNLTKLIYDEENIQNMLELAENSELRKALLISE